ncbi:protein translocase subunit SecF, partial [Candidatus Dependentiae bacterium]|nr:protein translocase subunit SecF [Candidatus Dependentiae bacterium]
FIAGLISIGYHKGLKYGIDFAGGANVIVKFNEPVTIEKLNEIRELLSSNNIEGNIQVFGKLGSEVNKVKISTGSDPLIESKITGIFQKHFDKNLQQDTSKLDINLLKSSVQISENLKKIFVESAVESISSARPINDLQALTAKLKKYNLSEDELSKIFIFTDAGISDVRKNVNALDNAGLINVFSDIFSSVKFIDYFNAVSDKAVQHIDKLGGLVKSVDELNTIFEFDSELFSKFKSQFSTSSFIIESVSMVGPSIGADYRKKGLLAIIVSLIAILIYIAWRFEFEFAVGAVIALAHDVLITIGIFSILDKEFNTQILAAILTLVGYSINDTIVVYDRIRENLKTGISTNLENIMNKSIIETLSRTIMTSLTTIIAVAAIYYFGGEVTKDFSLALLVGIIVGTYSSIFIASPVVIIWKKREMQKAKAGK